MVHGRKAQEENPTQIDLNGISDRVLVFPIQDGQHRHIMSSYKENGEYCP